MTAKEYLGQAYNINKRIQFAYDEIKRIRELAQSISSPMLGDKVQSSKKAEAPFVKYVDKLIEQEERIKAEVEELLKTQDDIIKSVECLEDFDEQTVLKYRHIYNYSWITISVKLNMSRSSVITLYNRALENFSEKLQK